MGAQLRVPVQAGRGYSFTVPVDRPVRFDITSSNMFNTFYAPTMAGMIYAMPGMHSQLHAIIDRPVDSEGYSANYSGSGFSYMRFAFRGVDDLGTPVVGTSTHRSGGCIHRCLSSPRLDVSIELYAVDVTDC